jgi:hypothetical protein
MTIPMGLATISVDTLKKWWVLLNIVASMPKRACHMRIAFVSARLDLNESAVSE